MALKGEPGFLDLTKYTFWFQDPNFKPRYVSRNEMAAMLGRSSQIVDNLIHVRGAPSRKKDRFVEVPLQPFLTWYFAYLSGMSVEDYKAELVENARQGGYLRGDPSYKGQPAPDEGDRYDGGHNEHVKALEAENRRLRASLRHLEEQGIEV